MSSSAGVKEWRRNTKQKLVEAFGGECSICGYNRCNSALDFHHIDPSTKETTWGALNGNIRGWDQIIAEVRKCVCLCANCHREVHAGLTIVPDTVQRFDPTLIRSHKRVRKIKPILIKVGPFDGVDLQREYQNHGLNYEAVGRKLGVTGAAVKRRLTLLAK